MCETDKRPSGAARPLTSICFQCQPGCLTIQLRTLLSVFLVLLTFSVTQACVVRISTKQLSDTALVSQHSPNGRGPCDQQNFLNAGVVCSVGETLDKWQRPPS